VRRIRLYLTEELDDALTREAVAKRVPKAALVRTYLAAQLGWNAEPTTDPIESLIGIYEGDSDESNNVDSVLYGS
jgi:hypothetical protein